MSFGENPLIKALREKAPKGENLFDCNASPVSYKTGIPVIDYYLGYLIKVYNKDDECVETYPSIGIPGGCFVTVIGKPSTSKTTFFTQIAAEIVRPFKSGSVIHFDLEQSQNYSRIRNLTKFTMTEMKAGKYILRQEQNNINDIKKSIMRVYKEKVDNPALYKYKTGKLDEFGEEIEVFEPTVILIDSIATLSTELNENNKDDLKKLEEVTSQTDKMRLAGEISRFFNELLPYIRTANIIVLTINQIKKNSEIGKLRTAAEIMYLDQDEATPGGKAPQFLAHILLKNIAIGSAKYTMEENGFDGFGLYIKIIKARTNQAGQVIEVIYDKLRGIDSLRTSLAYAKNLGLLGGNKNKMYFLEHKDQPFSLVNVHEDFKNNRELYRILYDSIIPSLKARLSMLDDSEMEIVHEEMDY